MELTLEVPSIFLHTYFDCGPLPYHIICSRADTIGIGNVKKLVLVFQKFATSVAVTYTLTFSKN